MTPALFRVGDRVTVVEDGIQPWSGDVITVKWSNKSGWWCDVRRADHMTYSVHEDNLTAAGVAA